MDSILYYYTLRQKIEFAKKYKQIGIILYNDHIIRGTKSRCI